ncbi:MAG: hypothetical protein UY56_C0005G0074 [Parcubacteria group bacterium GW2011_GWA1_50_14]|nr:MAG: hypothetical protein UY56_C0005G0074 [Parcubacteria group bacterium GW2011_GWA1_50_14]
MQARAGAACFSFLGTFVVSAWFVCYNENSCCGYWHTHSSDDRGIHPPLHAASPAPGREVPPTTLHGRRCPCYFKNKKGARSTWGFHYSLRAGVPRGWRTSDLAWPVRLEMPAFFWEEAQHGPVFLQDLFQGFGLRRLLLRRVLLLFFPRHHPLHG